MQQAGSTAHTALQQAAFEQPAVEWVVVQGPFTVAPQSPMQFESASAAQEASHVVRQQAGMKLQTVLQQFRSLQPGAAWTARQLSVPVPQPRANAGAPARSDASTARRAISLGIGGRS